MKSILLSTILLIPVLLTGCVGAGVDVGGYYPGYYGPDAGVYYYSHGSYYGHSYHHYSSYSHGASTVAVHSGSHFSGTRTASVSSSGHRSGVSHASSAHVTASRAY